MKTSEEMFGEIGEKARELGRLEAQNKVLRKLNDIKYRRHNPSKDCDCLTCEIVKEIALTLI